jgi:hypothetical protein
MNRRVDLGGECRSDGDGISVPTQFHVEGTKIHEICRLDVRTRFLYFSGCAEIDQTDGRGGAR